MGWVVNATPRSLYPWENPGTHCVRGWVGPRAGLEGEKNLVPTGIRSPDRPARGESLYRLIYLALGKKRIYFPCLESNYDSAVVQPVWATPSPCLCTEIIFFYSQPFCFCYSFCWIYLCGWLLSQQCNSATVHWLSFGAGTSRRKVAKFCILASPLFPPCPHLTIWELLKGYSWKFLLKFVGLCRFCVTLDNAGGYIAWSPTGYVLTPREIVKKRPQHK
jgi:hypothetical protein